MDSSSYIRALLATFCWNEPHEDALNGFIGAGLVISNRVRAGWSGGDWLAVLKSAPLFSYRALPLNPPPLTFGDIRNPIFQKILQRVDTIFSGSELDFTKGALYYARLNEITSEWFRQEILGHLDLHPRIADAGQLTFFK